MSELTYDDSFRETADDDHATQTRSVGTELADEPPAEPMSREEYADHMRQDPAADTGYEISDENDTEHTGDNHDSRWSDPAEQAQGMTREEYADYIRQGPAAGEDDHAIGDGHDADTTASPGGARPESPWSDPAEDAQGMTREEYADHMRQGGDALDSNIGLENVSETIIGAREEEAREADRAQREHSSADEPSAEERAHLREVYRDYLAENGSGWDQGENIAGAKPGRSPDDTSDAPSGEELLEMDGDKLSRFERLRNKTYKTADDIFDVSEKDGGTVMDLFDRPPMGSHTEIPPGHYTIEQPPAPGIDGGHFVLAGLMLGVVGIETTRALKDIARKWTGRHGHGGD